MEIKLNIVEDIDDVKEKGDALIVIGHNNLKQLIICCPKCGKVSGSSGNHVYNEETKTYTPSIVHNKDLGGCGWHGWLKNGIFTST